MGAEYPHVLGFYLFHETQRELFPAEFVKNLDAHTVEIGAVRSLYERLQKLPSLTIHLAVVRRRYSGAKHTDSLYLARVDFVRLVHLPLDLSRVDSRMLDRVQLHHAEVRVLGSEYSPVDLIDKGFKWLLDPPHKVLGEPVRTSPPTIILEDGPEPF